MQNVLDLKRMPPEPPVSVAEVPPPLTTGEASSRAPAPEQVVGISEPEPADVEALAADLIGAVQLPEVAAWTAHHPLKGEARRKHLYLSLGLVVIGIGISFMQSSAVPFFVLLAGALALELREHWGKPVEVGVDSRGVTINGHLHDHASFASFHIHRMPDETLELSLRSSRKYLPDIRLPMGDQDPEELHAVLTQHIPEQEHRIPLIEYFLRKPQGW